MCNVMHTYTPRPTALEFWTYAAKHGSNCICRPLLLIVLLKGLRAAGAQDFSEINLLILTAKAKFCEAEASILNYNLDP